jgi:site-specific DNA recombinase
VRDLLTDPDRRTGPGAAPRWHGSGIYRCGICTPPGTLTERPVTCEVTGGSDRKPGTGARTATISPTTPHTSTTPCSRTCSTRSPTPAPTNCCRPPAPDVDRDALYAERKAIRTRLGQMAEDEVLGLKTRAQVIAATKRATGHRRGATTRPEIS